jgi:hypothetical protein
MPKDIPENASAYLANPFLKPAAIYCKNILTV